MSFETARHTVDWIFTNIPDYADAVEIDFFGGEPLLEFPLIQHIFEYVCEIKPTIPYIFFATTNGTLLTDEMKSWFTERKEYFYLGLSLDGRKETHDHNRSNSFDLIDIDFFLQNWPDQGIKMTLSEFSLGRLAGDIKYIHSLGFKEIGGVNLAEGNFNWDKDEYLRLIVPQLAELVKFYVENDQLTPNMMLDKKLIFCEAKKNVNKWCGIGIGTPFFDVDGTRYPCTFITPMTFPKHELDDILKTDFTNNKNFIDDECFNNCYIYPICPTCSGANYMVNKTFKERNKSKCRIHKLIALFVADMEAKRIQKNTKRYDDTTLYYTIEAIKNIRALYLDEFMRFM
jgi:radical SAM protein with 4Fe4S-binding SPASM domain